MRIKMPATNDTIGASVRWRFIATSRLRVSCRPVRAASAVIWLSRDCMLEPGQGLDLYVTALSNLSDLSRGHRETKGILNEGRLRTGDPLTYGKLSAADATQRRE